MERAFSRGVIAVIAGFYLAGLPAGGYADTFSVMSDGVGAGGSDVAGTSPDGAHLFDAPLDGTNGVALTPGNLGLTAEDEIDALSFGFDGIHAFDYYFSLAGSGDTQVVSPSQLPFPFLDALASDFGLGGDDDLDAHDLFAAPFTPGVDGDVYFSLAGSGDIFKNDVGNLFLSATQLGITGLDLDALAIELDGGGGLVGVLFSVDNTTGTGADLLLSTGDGTYSTLWTAAQLGLQATDNINALSSAAIPEPVSMTLVGSTLAGLLLWRRKKDEEGGMSR